MLSKTLIFFLILNFVSDSYGQRDKKFFRKDYHYIEDVESFYKIHVTPLGWTDAKRVCALEAATFFYPETEYEAKAVLSFWNKTKPSVNWVWIGISDLLVEGVFETVDGKPISEVHTKWVQGEPNDYGRAEDCVSFNLKEVMNDYICGIHAHFICKKSLKTLDWNTECDMPNKDYTLSKDIGKCYKLHTTPLKWNEAYAMCQLEQSTLAVINNRREVDYLVKVIASTPRPKVKEQYQRGIYHLGFHNKLKEGWQTVKDRPYQECKTGAERKWFCAGNWIRFECVCSGPEVAGQPMNVDGDTWYDNYQPDGNDHEECGSMFYTGRLINTHCDMKSFFICEHELDHIISPVGDSLVNQPYVGGGIDK